MSPEALSLKYFSALRARSERHAIRACVRIDPNLVALGQGVTPLIERGSRVVASKAKALAALSRNRSIDQTRLWDHAAIAVADPKARRGIEFPQSIEIDRTMNQIVMTLGRPNSSSLVLTHNQRAMGLTIPRNVTETLFKMDRK